MKIIKIKDYYGNYQEVPVEDSLYEEWVKLNNDDQRIYRREMYHRSGMSPEEAVEMQKTGSIEELVDDLLRRERNAHLYEAISQLTPTQQRRVMMFMDNMNYTDIARSEGTKFAPIYRSLQAAFKKLRLLMREYEKE